MRSEQFLVRAAAAMLLAAAMPAWAHVEQAGGGSGFVAGLLHPVLGPDHLLAMVAVGMWGAVLGRPLVLALPVAFPLLMLIGAALALLGIEVPAVETGIALSVLVLGLAIAFAWRAPLVVAVAVVGAFGVFHGHAHGTELPQSATPAAYAAGFLLSTGALHLAGIAIGLLWPNRTGRRIVQAGGAAIAAAGIWFLAQAMGLA